MRASVQTNSSEPMEPQFTVRNTVDQLYQTYSFSGDSAYLKSAFRPRSSIQSYYALLNHLTDVLSKREFLYRQFFESTNKVLRLPLELTANPQNLLLQEVKAGFLFIDPTNYVGEESRNSIYNSTSYLRIQYLSDALTHLSFLLGKSPVNTGLLENFFLFYFFNTNTDRLGSNHELYKNPYRPLRRGVNDLLRFHATGAIALPVELRLQILASSRDVIHS